MRAKRAKVSERSEFCFGLTKLVTHVETHLVLDTRACEVHGVWKTRTLMRRHLEERWDQGALGLVGGVPWRVNDDDPKADGEAMKMDIPSEARHATEQEKEEMAQAPIPVAFPCP